jgi:hypothetical protein
MKFGKIDNPETVDFTLPKDHPRTKRVLKKSKAGSMEIRIGCAKWIKKTK